ncbi:MAG: biotin-dependent carboxyltransferase family protein [Gemmataceae bacterium]
MSLTVVAPGLYTLPVDAGRPGHRALGVPTGGAADRAALALGNALVGNPPDACALELTLAGPTLRADAPAVAVVFGAPFAVAVNDRVIPAGTTFRLAPGDTLRIGGTAVGVRGYLCVAGGFNLPVILGSRTALEPLKVGDVLPCGTVEAPIGRLLPEVTTAALVTTQPPNRPTTLQVLDGPQREWFADDRFFTTEYTVSPTSNRMGVRLVGEPLSRRPGELVSEPVAPGAVQVLNDGRPVVLGVDGQTIGGYPKVTHIIRADLDRLAQLRPGDAIRFRRVTAAEAEAAARERASRLRGGWRGCPCRAVPRLWEARRPGQWQAAPTAGLPKPRHRPTPVAAHFPWIPAVALVIVATNPTERQGGRDMGSWIGSGCLVAVTAGMVWFVSIGPAGHSHCGPCLGTCPAAPVVAAEAEAEQPRLLHLAPAVRYDEPPLARFTAPPPATAPGLVQATYQESATPLVEVAPMPRPVVPPGGPRIAGPNDRF